MRLGNPPARIERIIAELASQYARLQLCDAPLAFARLVRANLLLKNRSTASSNPNQRLAMTNKELNPIPP